MTLGNHRDVQLVTLVINLINAIYSDDLGNLIYPKRGKRPLQTTDVISPGSSLQIPIHQNLGPLWARIHPQSYPISAQDTKKYVTKKTDDVKLILALKGQTPQTANLAGVSSQNYDWIEATKVFNKYKASDWKRLSLIINIYHILDQFLRSDENVSFMIDLMIVTRPMSENGWQKHWKGVQEKLGKQLSGGSIGAKLLLMQMYLIHLSIVIADLCSRAKPQTPKKAKLFLLNPHQKMGMQISPFKHQLMAAITRYWMATNFIELARNQKPLSDLYTQKGDIRKKYLEHLEAYVDGFMKRAEEAVENGVSEQEVLAMFQKNPAWSGGFDNIYRVVNTGWIGNAYQDDYDKSKKNLQKMVQQQTKQGIPRNKKLKRPGLPLTKQEQKSMASLQQAFAKMNKGLQDMFKTMKKDDPEGLKKYKLQGDEKVYDISSMLKDTIMGVQKAQQEANKVAQKQKKAQRKRMQTKYVGPTKIKVEWDIDAGFSSQKHGGKRIDAIFTKNKDGSVTSIVSIPKLPEDNVSDWLTSKTDFLVKDWKIVGSLTQSDEQKFRKQAQQDLIEMFENNLESFGGYRDKILWNYADLLGYKANDIIKALRKKFDQVSRDPRSSAQLVGLAHNRYSGALMLGIKSFLLQKRKEFTFGINEKKVKSPKLAVSPIVKKEQKKKLSKQDKDYISFCLRDVKHPNRPRFIGFPDKGQRDTVEAGDVVLVEIPSKSTTQSYLVVVLLYYTMDYKHSQPEWVGLVTRKESFTKLGYPNAGKASGLNLYNPKKPDLIFVSPKNFMAIQNSTQKQRDSRLRAFRKKQKTIPYLSVFK
jgi:hypothetical protein